MPESEQDARGVPSGPVAKNPACNARETGFIPGLIPSPGRAHMPLSY